MSEASPSSNHRSDHGPAPPRFWREAPPVPGLAFSQGGPQRHPGVLVQLKPKAFPPRSVLAVPSPLMAGGQPVAKSPAHHTVPSAQPCRLDPGNGRVELALACSRNRKGTKSTHITPGCDMKKAFFFSWYPRATFPASLQQQSGAGLGILSCLGVTHLLWHSSGLLLPARPGLEGRWLHKNSRGALEVPLLQLLC